MAKPTFKYELGDVVRDVINNFEGPITGRAQYLTGCTQYLVGSSKLDKDGKIQEGYWIDEGRLALKPRAKAVQLPQDQPPGGPRQSPPSRVSSSPRRR